jgi:hypothetical protein
MKQVKTKFDGLLKTAKVVNPPASAEYTEEDFIPFFQAVAKKLGKTHQEMFSKHIDLLKMLGSIPIPIKKKIEIKTLPFHASVTNDKGKTFCYSGNLNEKN